MKYEVAIAIVKQLSQYKTEPAATQLWYTLQHN